jgi:hypothetical protein
MARTRRNHWKLFSVGALAITTATISLYFCISLLSPSAPLPSALAPADEARAKHALSTVGDRDVAAQATEASLRRAPLSAEAWTRMAYLRQPEGDLPSTAALEDLSMSYVAAPLGPDISRWRIRYLFENWPSLSPSLRLKALAELRNFAHFHRGSGALSASVDNPAGRMAANLAIRQGYADAENEAQAKAGEDRHNRLE